MYVFKFGPLWARLTSDPSSHRPLCFVSVKRTTQMDTTGPIKLHLIDANLSVLANMHHRFSSYITNLVSRESVYSERTIFVWFPLDYLVTWWSGFINLFVKLKSKKKHIGLFCSCFKNTSTWMYQTAASVLFLLDVVLGAVISVFGCPWAFLTFWQTKAKHLGLNNFLFSLALIVLTGKRHIQCFLLASYQSVMMALSPLFTRLKLWPVSR